VIFAAGHHWEIRTSVPVGLTQETPDIGAEFQLTWKFGAGQQ
jgi:hypothetical protein